MYINNITLYNSGVNIVYTLDIKTHDSESRGQEEAGRTRQMSVLFTCSTTVKFVSALNKPPSYRLVIKDSACSI